MTPGRVDRLCLGWQYATPYPDPGPSPRRPTPPDAERLSPEWEAAQRREEKRLNRPLRVAVAVAAVIGLMLVGLGAAGWLDVLVAGLGVICCALIAAVGGYAIWQGERALRSRLAEERVRVSKARAEQESQLLASQEEHARRVRDWQAHRVAYEHQKRWYAVCAPDGIKRVDLVGGTPSGWSAMLTTAGAHRLAAGGEVTVIDLSEGPAALDLLGFARASGIEPLVWVLPDDLPRLDLGRGLGKDGLAEVLSMVASVSHTDTDSARALWLDNAILQRVIDALGGTPAVASVTAALRVLAQVGDPREDVASGLISAAQVDRLGVVFRRGATDRMVFERACVLEARLRKLAALGTDPAALPRSALRVAALSGRVAAAEAEVLGTFLVVALTHALRGTRPGRPWQHTLFVLAADRLRDDALDRLCDVCESTGTGLVLAFRAMPPPVRQRLGRGNAAAAFMRLGNAEEAKAVSERLGTEHGLVLSQLTQAIGLSVVDTAASSYASTAGSAGSATTSPSASEGSARSLLLPAPATLSGNAQTRDSRGTGDRESVRVGIATSTTWGTATSKAASDSESLALAMHRSRKFLIEQHELQQLPASAMIVAYTGPSGMRVILADVNPGIGGLAAATELTLEEYRSNTPAVTAESSDWAGPEAAASADGRQTQAGSRPIGTRSRPNVGPPPPRLDWRKRRS